MKVRYFFIILKIMGKQITVIKISVIACNCFESQIHINQIIYNLLLSLLTISSVSTKYPMQISRFRPLRPQGMFDISP